jgi:hypothetical protein
LFVVFDVFVLFDHVGNNNHKVIGFEAILGIKLRVGGRRYYRVALQF